METSPYQLDTLLATTRQLAADYRRSTGQSLPLTQEIAKQDCFRSLSLTPVKDLAGIDALSKCLSLSFQIKGRLIPQNSKAREKLGTVAAGDWDAILLATYDESYECTAIYQLDRKTYEAAIHAQNLETLEQKPMTVAKFIHLADCVFQSSVSV